MLKVTDEHGNIDWAYKPVIVATALQPPTDAPKTAPGLKYRYYEGNWTSLPDFSAMSALRTGEVKDFDESIDQNNDHFGIVYSGYLDVPVDGGYTFTLLSRDGGKIEIGSKTVAVSPAPFPQVCGAIGNSVQAASGSVALKAGKHPIRITYTKSIGDNAFALRWEGPGTAASPIPGTALSY